MYKISKAFEIDFGHRIPNQELNNNLAGDVPCACRHLHGHRGKIIVELEAKELEQGMVTDFHHLNWFKKWLDKYLDHKMILASSDLALPILVTYPLPHVVEDAWVYEKIPGIGFLSYPDPLRVLQLLSSSRAERDVVEGIVLVPFVPTAENLSKMLFKLVQERLSNFKFNNCIKVSKVTFYETPKSQSVYTEEL